jgi:hypothetical protein
MPYLRWVVIGFSQQRPGFIHRVVPREYAVRNMTPVLGGGLSPNTSSFPCKLSFY